HFLAGKGKRLKLFFGSALGDGQRVAQLAFHLDGNGHFVLHQQGWIEAGPGGIGDEAFVEGGKRLFRQVRHHGRDQQQERANGIGTARRWRSLLYHAREFVYTVNRLVEAQRLDLFADCRDGLMDLAIDSLVLALRRRIVLLEEAPQTLNEPGATFDTGFRPGQVPLRRAVRKHEPADCVGAVGGDDLIRIDNVLLRLRHLDDAPDLNRLAIGLERRALTRAFDFTGREVDRLPVVWIA